VAFGVQQEQDEVGAPLGRVEIGQVGGVELHERGGGEVDAVGRAEQVEQHAGALAKQGDEPFMQVRGGHGSAP
jgi:hypothetical protein